MLTSGLASCQTTFTKESILARGSYQFYDFAKIVNMSYCNLIQYTDVSYQSIVSGLAALVESDSQLRPWEFRIRLYFLALARSTKWALGSVGQSFEMAKDNKRAC